MATIEERAYKAFCGRTSCRPDSKIHSLCINCLHDSRKDAYIKGAIEQREIDIEKAIECTCRICNPQCMPEFKKCDFDKNKCRKIALLRKAMMEE